LTAYEAASGAPAAKAVRTRRGHPPDFLNIKVEDLVGDRPFDDLDKSITQDELPALWENDKRGLRSRTCGRRERPLARHEGQVNPMTWALLAAPFRRRLFGRSAQGLLRCRVQWAWQRLEWLGDPLCGRPARHG